MELKKDWSAQIEDYVIDLAWSGAGHLLAAASASGPIGIFEGGDGKRKDLPGHENGTNCIDFNPSSATLASGGQDGAVKIWDALAGQNTASTKLGEAWVELVQWRRGEKTDALLAAACGRKLVLLGPDGAIRHSLPEAGRTVAALAWHPTKPILAAASFGAVRLFDAEKGALENEFPYANAIQALAWSPDGRWLVSGNQDRSVHLWRPEEETELQMSGYEGKVKDLSFDRSGRWLATSGGRDACVWDCSGAGPEGRAPGMLPHDGPVSAVRFQFAHGLLATGSEDGAIHLWSPERPQPLRASLRLPGKPTRIAWSKDDLRLAFGSDRGAVYVLSCKP